jgi:predicted ArsR family transcriptional regulator
MGLHSGSTADRIMEWFSAYGTATARTLADELGIDYRLVCRTLYRLRARGLVVSRPELMVVFERVRSDTTPRGDAGYVWQLHQPVNTWTAANTIVLECGV